MTGRGFCAGTALAARSVMTRNYLVVLNERAGGAHRVEDLEARITEGLTGRHGARVVIVRLSDPDGPQRAARLARSRQWDAVIAAGGDGTHHWLLEALAGTGVPLGIIPLGTANDLARACGIPADVAGACRVIRADQRARLDLVRAGEQPFVTSGGVGLPADVALTVLRLRRRWRVCDALSRLLGFHVYSLVLLLLVLCSRRTWRRLVVEEEDGAVRRVEAHVALVMNQSFLGRSFHPAPAASHRDGELDLVLVLRRRGPLGRLHLLRTLLATMRGRHLGRPDVLLLRGRRFALQVEEQGRSACQEPFFADGEELTRGARFEVGLERKALTVIVPAAAASLRLPRFSPLLLSSAA